MLKIDAHQHFWKYEPIRDSWITNEMAVIQKDFLPQDLQPVLTAHNISGCVAVEAEQSEPQNDFLLGLAEEYDFIKGVVGWIDFEADNLEERLKHYQQFKLLKGFRHSLQGETNRAKMLEPDFMKGISLLKEFNYTFDILIHADQLKFIPAFVAAFPEQKFVIDHMAKPQIRLQAFEDWRNEIASVSTYENVFCKISGMVTEADWNGWQKKDFTPYLDVVFNAFGSDRIMFGSDWPVCLLAANYDQVIDIISDYIKELSKDEQEKIFAGNAIGFYNLT